MKSRQTLLNLSNKDLEGEKISDAKLKQRIKVGENIGGVHGRASMEKVLLADKKNSSTVAKRGR